MAEYIKRDTAIRAVMAAKWVDGSDGAMAMEIVASPPAADVAPVVHGRWIERKEHFYFQNGCKEWINFYCSECDAPNNSPTDYCPNCGAKMDGGTDND